MGTTLRAALAGTGALLWCAAASGQYQHALSVTPIPGGDAFIRATGVPGPGVAAMGLSSLLCCGRRRGRFLPDRVRS